jgi:hypothetical protein
LAAERPELVRLLQRLVELLTRRFGERVESARDELGERARLLGRRASLALAGALALAVGLALAGAAAVEALAPLVASRPARLVLVAAPFLAVGAGALWRCGERREEEQRRRAADRVP